MVIFEKDDLRAIGTWNHEGRMSIRFFTESVDMDGVFTPISYREFYRDKELNSKRKKMEPKIYLWASNNNKTVIF